MCLERLIRMLAAVIILTAWVPASASDTAPKTGADRYVASISITGAIGPATAKYVRDTLLSASPQKVEAVILRLNTPGGLATSMREIIADVLASPVPVIGFVAPASPRGARAPTFFTRPMWPPWRPAQSRGCDPGADQRPTTPRRSSQRTRTVLTARAPAPRMR